VIRLLGFLLAAKAIKTGVVAGVTGRPYSFPPRNLRHRTWLFRVRLGGAEVTDLILLHREVSRWMS
jgi:hypothetical protein